MEQQQHQFNSELIDEFLADNEKYLPPSERPPPRLTISEAKTMQEQEEREQIQEEKLQTSEKRESALEKYL